MIWKKILCHSIYCGSSSHCPMHLHGHYRLFCYSYEYKTNRIHRRHARIHNDFSRVFSRVTGTRDVTGTCPLSPGLKNNCTKGYYYLKIIIRIFPFSYDKTEFLLAYLPKSRKGTNRPMQYNLY